MTVKVGDLVKYSWAGSNRVALVLDYRTETDPKDLKMKWYLNLSGEIILIQWISGEGPKDAEEPTLSTPHPL